MRECNCGCEDKEVLIKESFLDVLLINLSESIRGESTQTPTFEPDPNLGDGMASDQEMANRNELLQLLRDLWEYVELVMNSNISNDEKKKQLDTAIIGFIKDGQELVERQVRDSYNEGKKQASAELKELGIEVDSGIEDVSWINALVEQQRDNIESMGFRIRSELKQQLNLQRVFGFYGKY